MVGLYHGLPSMFISGVKSLLLMKKNCLVKRQQGGVVILTEKEDQIDALKNITAIIIKKTAITMLALLCRILK